MTYKITNGTIPRFRFVFSLTSSYSEEVRKHKIIFAIGIVSLLTLILIFFYYFKITQDVLDITTDRNRPQIRLIDPMTMHINESIKITSTFLTRENNTIQLQTADERHLGYVYDTHLVKSSQIEFTLPEQVYDCSPTEHDLDQSCLKNKTNLSSGKYYISVINANGVSNTILITIEL